ncbi:MAG: VCBS repeat-containing protein [Acidobacteriota bacterium]
MRAVTRSWCPLRVLKVILGVLVLGLFCSAEVGESAQGMLGLEEKQYLNRVDQSVWKSELYLEELQPLLERLLAQIAAPAELKYLLHEEFRGVPPATRTPQSQVRESGVRISRYSFAQITPIKSRQFLQELRNYALGFDAINRREFHIRRLAIEGNGDQPVVVLEMDTYIGGASDGLRRADSASWVASLTRSAEDVWRLMSLRVRHLESARGHRIFTDVTSLLPESYKLTHPRTHRYTDFPANNGVSLADWDQDGDLDIYVFRPYLPGLFYVNDGVGRFREQIPDGLEESEAESTSLSGTGYFFDADNDGDLDFLQLRNDSPIGFFRNESGRFSNVAREAGFARLPDEFWIGAAIADYDLDGDLDIYLLRYADRNPRSSYFDSRGNANFLLRNEGNGIFKEVTLETGMTSGNKRISWAAAWGDYNDDGYPDLYVANDFGPNRLYTNQLDGTFAEDSRALGVEDRGNGMGVSWVDYDNDGVLDLYVSNMHSYSGERITHSAESYLTPGQARLAQRFSKGNTLFRGIGHKAFQEVTPELTVAKAGWAWGHLFLDYDYDGDLDLYVVNGYFSNLKSADS